MRGNVSSSIDAEVSLLSCSTDPNRAFRRGGLVRVCTVFVVLHVWNSCCFCHWNYCGIILFEAPTALHCVRPYAVLADGSSVMMEHV